jgi:hypothetical protein
VSTRRAEPPAPRDLAARRIGWLVWGVPIAVIVAAGFAPPLWRTILWCGALTAAGVACVINARRCGRRHCFYTGPFYLAAALVTAAYGSGLVTLPFITWSRLALAIAGGSVLLQWLPERIWGKYVSRS